MWRVTALLVLALGIVGCDGPHDATVETSTPTTVGTPAPPTTEAPSSAELLFSASRGSGLPENGIAYFLYSDGMLYSRQWAQDLLLERYQVTSIDDEALERFAKQLEALDELPQPAPSRQFIMDGVVSSLRYPADGSERQLSIQHGLVDAGDDPRAEDVGTVLSELKKAVSESASTTDYVVERVAVSASRNDGYAPETKDWPLERAPTAVGETQRLSRARGR